MGFYEQEIEFREQLKYPPVSRIALLTLKGRNEEKVQFSAEHLKQELEKLKRGETGKVGPQKCDTVELGLGLDEAVLAPNATTTSAQPLRDLIIAGPAPAPLLRAETFYRYQIMLRTRQMSLLSQALARLLKSLVLPDDVTLTVDIDPVNLS